MLYRSTTSGSKPRQGIVLVAVLVVVTVLALAAYQYSDMMSAEYKAADSNTRTAQTRSFAWSGVYYTAGILSDSNFFTNTLSGNPYDNAQYFQDILVQDDDNSKRRGHFSIIALRNLDDPLATSQPFRFGVEDEASKLNVNALLKYDKTGTIGLQMLQSLPNMTDTPSESILDWINGASATSNYSSGAKDDYYMGLSPPYHCKNGPLDSLDEMMYIQGVTSDLLWGNDLNFNGVLDPGEVGGSNSGSIDRGWAQYLTIYSREANISSSGTPRVYINDPSLATLQTNMTTAFSGNAQSLMLFIVAYRLYGPAATTTTSSKSGTKTTAAALSSSDQQAAAAQIAQDATASANSSSSGGTSKLTAISSLYSLITASVSVKTGSGMSAKTITLPSPLSDPTQLATLLPILLDNCTTSQNPDLNPRINVNTASQTVLMSLVKQSTQSSNSTSTTTTTTTGTSTTGTQTAAMTTGLQATDVQSIINNQPQYTGGNPVDSSYQTPAWLITKAGLTPQAVQSIEPFITARSTVFRFQVLGYFEGGGPMTRLEAVVDTNYGRPRIVYVRNLTELGKVYDMTQIQLNQ